MSSILRAVQQAVFIPKPSLTEANLPDQSGKVHIVTGGYAGVGHELVQILYAKNATVYSAGRSLDKANKSINAIKEAHPASKGSLHFLQVDLSDLTTIKRAADEFLSKETRLDVLTNNAGVMIPPKGSKDAQGYELQMGTNCLGPFLFTFFLTPLLKETAAKSPAGSVRVTFAGSSATEFSPKGGVQFDADGEVQTHDSPQLDYGQSKVANVFLAHEFAQRHGKDGIISVAWNPGNLKSDLQRHVPALGKLAMNIMLHAPIYGAYTELFSGWSEDVTQEHNGSYIIPWGRFGGLRPDIVAGLKSEAEGGSGASARLWDWSVKSTKKYT